VLEDQILLLKNLDDVPYSVEEEDGRFRLFIGAFLDIKVAEKNSGIWNPGVSRVKSS
jgi:hypothetical protein